MTGLVVVQCTSGSLPAGFVADLRQVIEHYNAGGVDVAFTCQDTIQVPATTSSRGQPRGYPGGDSPVLDGSQDEPSCPHCLFGPCIIRRPPMFLTGRAAPSLANDRMMAHTVPAILAAVKRPDAVGPPNIPGKEGIGDALGLFLVHPNNSAYIVEDILLPNWALGKPAAFDISVTSPLNPKIVSVAGLSAGAAALSTEERKHTENDPKCNALGWCCAPLVTESYGAWGKEAMDSFKMLASCLAIISGKPKSVVLYSRLNLHLVRANATATLSGWLPS
eukprot:Em0014g450a